MTLLDGGRSMVIIPLSSIPNQTFSILLDQSFYNITLKEANGIMVSTIVRDNILIQSGARIVSGFPLIPYKYQEQGNFTFSTLNQEYPYYTKFNTTQVLYFATAAELQVIRAGT